MAGALAPFTCCGPPAAAQRPVLGPHLSPCRQGGHRARQSAQERPRRRLLQAAAALGGPAPAEDEEERLPDGLQFQRGNCYGCGTRLQIADTDVAGYVEPERYEIKRRRRQLHQLLCLRCQELSNGAMIPAVADFGAVAPLQGGGGEAAAAPEAVEQGDPPAAAAPAKRHTGFTDKVLLTPEELREKLKVVQGQRALVVLLADLLDASGTLLGRVRHLVGANPIVLVGTKADLLPPGADPAAVAAWLQAAAAFKRINAVSVHLVSNRTGAGVPAAVAAIRRERRGRDVYVMGAANVGKSAFIRALVRDMSAMSSRQYDAAAAARSRYLPVESAMPGTTLELIPMEVFAAGGVLYDTPGLHLHHRVPHLLTPAENKQLHPRRRLRPYVPPSPSELLEATAAACGLPPGGGATAAAADRSCAVATYWWGGLAKLQLLSCPPDTELAFYGPQALLVEASVEAAAAADGADGSDPPSAAAASDSAAQPAAAAVAAAATADSAVDPAAATAAAPAWGEAEAEEPHGFGAASVMRRGGLRPAKTLRLQVGGGGGGGRRAVADVAVSGIPGWVAVHASGGPGATVVVRVWTPPGVEVFHRPPMPLPSPLADSPAAPAPAAATVAAPAAGGLRRQAQGQAGEALEWW